MNGRNGNSANRTALVSGAGQGLGQAFAERLAKDGLNLVLADLEDPEETAGLVKAAGGRSWKYLCDVSDPESVENLAAEMKADGLKVDVLLNNAGIYPYQQWQDISFEDWRRVMSVNLDSVFLMTKAFVPAMRESGWGRVINLTTGSCFLPNPMMSHYITSKMGVIGYTRALATEISDDGITVNAIAPSYVPTPGTISASEDDEEWEIVARAQSIKRTQMPADLVGTVSFLASDDSAFITAQTFSVDGGLVRL